jgi:uncharacterized protein (TIGR03435 family)
MQRATVLLGLTSVFLLAQAPARGQSSKLEFEVATVKPFDLRAPSVRKPPVSGGPETSDPERIAYHTDLRKLFMQAYGVRSNQVAGPEWIKADGFDIVAKVPAHSTVEQVNVMLQNLLRDRFGVTVHHEMRNAPAYAMVVAKGGLKLKDTAYPNASADAPDSLSFTRDKNDFPILPPELAAQIRVNWSKNGAIRSTFRAYPVARLVQEVEGSLPDFTASEMGPDGVPPRVLDRTGLTGKYDFTLEYSDGSADAFGPSIFSALEKQLGLRLDKIGVPQDVIVIDRINRTPLEN